MNKEASSAVGTLRDQIVALVEVSPGLSDREVTDRIIGESAAQQTTNQATRALERQGRLIRRARSDGKIGNYPSGLSVNDSLTSGGQRTTIAKRKSGYAPCMNAVSFLIEPERYFNGAYEEFLAFGGPSVYFHQRCLEAAELGYLSERHVEMLYATLTAWGMHRMGDLKTTKTKLTDWPTFSHSIATQAAALEAFRNKAFLSMTVDAYSEAIMDLRPIYRTLNLSVSRASVVVNSKALFHLLPDLVPPIDRQFTLRFFQQPSDHWRDSNGKFRMVNLPAGFDNQFGLFHDICVSLKQLADDVGAALFERERQAHGVVAPKALDNAIVSYVRIVSSGA